MSQLNIDDLLQRLADRADAGQTATLEQRVWSRIALENQVVRGPIGLFQGGGHLGWRLSAGAIALAAGAGFLTATLAPPVASAREVNIEVWSSPDTPLAPSTILGG